MLAIDIFIFYTFVWEAYVFYREYIQRVMQLQTPASLLLPRNPMLSQVSIPRQ